MRLAMVLVHDGEHDFQHMFGGAERLTDRRMRSVTEPLMNAREARQLKSRSRNEV